MIISKEEFLAQEPARKKGPAERQLRRVPSIIDALIDPYLLIIEEEMSLIQFSHDAIMLYWKSLV